MMSLISRKEFLDKLALVAFVPLADEEYKKPEIISWKLETLNSAESYAKSFENMDYYDHTLNSLPSVDDLDRYNHIFTAAHGIEDAETWAPQIESMVKSKSCYAGECLRGKSGTSEQHMLLGYQKNIDDNQQLWAYVEKVNHLVQTAGINEPPRKWVNDQGFLASKGSDMKLCDLVYSEMRKALIRGADQKNRPYMDGDDWTTVGRYIIYSERNVTWADASSVDPSIFEVFTKGFEEEFSDSKAGASETLAFVEKYLIEQEPVFNFSYQEDDSELLDTFNAGVDSETWERNFNDFSAGLVEL